MIRHVPKELQTLELCKIAIKQSSYVIYFIKDQTPELCKMAVQQNGCSINVIRKQTPELCLDAYLQNPKSLNYIRLSCSIIKDNVNYTFDSDKKNVLIKYE